MAENERRCRRCRAPPAENARFCSQCGMRLEQRSPGRMLLDALGAVALGVVALVLGGTGACFLFAGAGMLGEGSGSALGGVLMLILAVGALAGVAKITRREG
jgi:predicted nucleic acid-binding Zn ribbon protein